MSIPEHGGIARTPGNMRPYDLDTEIEDAIDQIRFNTMVTYSRLATNYQLAAFCEKTGMPGAFVECGVWKGGVSGLMAIANLKHGRHRRDLYLFDSFTDLCEPDDTIDGERAVREARDWGGRAGVLAGALVPMEGFYSQMGGPGTIAECVDLIVGQIGYPRQNLHIREGWFQDTIEPSRTVLDEIAVLRIDCDYYKSTKYCLEALYDRVVRGGFVLIDDYGWYDGCKRAVDEFVASLPSPIYLHHADADCRYLVKP